MRQSSAPQSAEVCRVSSEPRAYALVRTPRGTARISVNNVNVRPDHDSSARREGATMLLFTRSRFCPSSVAVAAGLIAAATALAADPAEAPSLAEYITAICSAAFRSAPPEEAPFLAENVGAMTTLIVGMG